MPTVRDWEDYIDMEEELHLQETRKKFHQKKKSHNKQTWDKLETKTKMSAPHFSKTVRPTKSQHASSKLPSVCTPVTIKIHPIT